MHSPKSQLTILLYHGVTDKACPGIENYSGKHIGAKEFSRQMRDIRDKCTVLSMNDIVEIKTKGLRYPPNAVAVSFDDGFENNYTTAVPILEELGIPCVFYIASGIVGTEEMFWVDEIEDCLNLTQSTQVRVHLNTDVTLPLGNDAQKIQAAETVKAYCKRQLAERKNKVVAELRDATGVTPSVHHADNYRKLTWNQLKEMWESPLFTIGGHSLHHNILSQLSAAGLNHEVTKSLALLKKKLGSDIRHYSYPEGQKNHYNKKVIDQLKQCGIVCSPSAISGVNDETTDLFHFRRVMVGFMDMPFPNWLF